MSPDRFSVKPPSGGFFMSGTHDHVGGGWHYNSRWVVLSLCTPALVIHLFRVVERSRGAYQP